MDTEIFRIAFQELTTLFSDCYFKEVWIPKEHAMFLFETGSYYVRLISLELTIYSRKSPNSQRSVCLYHPNAGIKDVYHHVWPELANLLQLSLWPVCLCHKLLERKQNSMNLMITGSGGHQIAAVDLSALALTLSCYANIQQEKFFVIWRRMTWVRFTRCPGLS